jgi:hypothetical protein
MFHSQRRAYLDDPPEFSAKSASTAKVGLTQAIPLVLAGGTVIPDGFQDRFKSALQSNELPVKLSEVRISSEPLNATARGALMAALC